MTLHSPYLALFLARRTPSLPFWLFLSKTWKKFSITNGSENSQSNTHLVIWNWVVFCCWQYNKHHGTTKGLKTTATVYYPKAIKISDFLYQAYRDLNSHTAEYNSTHPRGTIDGEKKLDNVSKLTIVSPWILLLAYIPCTRKFQLVKDFSYFGFPGE